MAKRKAKATASDIANLTNDLKDLFLKYNGIIWRVKEGAQVKQWAETVVFFLISFVTLRNAAIK